MLYDKKLPSLKDKILGEAKALKAEKTSKDKIEKVVSKKEEKHKKSKGK